MILISILFFFFFSYPAWKNAYICKKQGRVRKKRKKKFVNLIFNIMSFTAWQVVFFDVWNSDMCFLLYFWASYCFYCLLLILWLLLWPLFFLVRFPFRYLFGERCHLIAKFVVTNTRQPIVCFHQQHILCFSGAFGWNTHSNAISLIIHICFQDSFEAIQVAVWATCANRNICKRRTSKIKSQNLGSI